MAEVTKIASSRTALLGASGLSIPPGGSVETRGFLTEGDGGGGLYKEVTAPATALQTNPAYIHIAGDRWLQLVPHGNALFSAQFGAKADSNSSGAGGTDHLPVLRNMLALVALSELGDTRGYRIVFGPGHHYFSDTLEVHTTTYMTGGGGGFERSGITYWHVPPNKSFIRFRHFHTSGGGSTYQHHMAVSPGGTSAGSVLENLVFWGSNASTTFDQHGIEADVVIHLSNLAVVFAAGHGYHIHASPEFATISDFSTVRNCSVQHCRGNGFHTEGGDANVCHFSMISSQAGEVWGCGVYDGSWYGNKYDNVHIAGYRNIGVQYGGRAYKLLLGDGYATTPGTNNEVWYDVGALAAPNANFTAWSTTPNPADPYRPTIAFLTSGGNNIIDNLYVEGDGLCHVPAKGIITGGQHNPTLYTNSFRGHDVIPGVFTPQGVGGWRSYIAGQAGYAQNGANAFALVGTVGSGEGSGLAILDHYSEHTGVAARYQLHYYNGNMDWRSVPISGTSPPFSATTGTTSLDFGRTTPQQNKQVLFDHAVVDPGDIDLRRGRMRGARHFIPTGEYHAAGEFFWNIKWFDIISHAGTYWTAAGNPGTYGFVPIFGLRSISPTENGEMLIEATSDTAFTVKYKTPGGVLKTKTFTYD